MIKNLQYINPIKREKIKKGLEYIEKKNNGCISKVIVFGSSVTDACTNDSDIDLCFVTDTNCTNHVYANIYGNMEIIMDDLCDILSYNKLSDNGDLKAEINKKGIVVYEYK